MSTWPQDPTIYEINTWVWLNDLSTKYGTRVDLSSVPSAEWDNVAKFGFDAVWLMGVWERSPVGTAIANSNPGLRQDFEQALRDFKPEDNVGSPYCVRRYRVDQQLGGPEALAVARRELAERRMKLLLDFVPNHIAPDHSWILEHPDRLVQGTLEEARAQPGSFLEIGGRVFACGRDPYFPAWPDVLQLNAFQPGLRQAAIGTLCDIASQCDGVRCDMAMLMMNIIFERTWGSRVGPSPAIDYWPEVIPAVNAAYPDFLFIAEAYWNLEWELQQQGFDFCYDKRAYDRIVNDNAESLRLHLSANIAYQRKLLRFLENHDEPRAAAILSPQRERAAAVVVATLPGARLFHEGQFEGRRIKLPVFLGRRPQEPPDADLQAFYLKLLQATNASVFQGGEWRLCDRSGWPDNSTYLNLVAWIWLKEGSFRLVVVNLSDQLSQARAQVPWPELSGKTWRLTDIFSGSVYERNGDEMLQPGVYVELRPWQFNLFEFQSTDVDTAWNTVAPQPEF